MKTLFGTPKIEYKQSANGAPVAGDWKELDLPKDATSTLDTSEGATTEAKDESGKIVDSFTEPGTSTLAFELFKKKNLALAFPVVRGKVAGEWAIRVSNAIDPSAPAYQIDRCTLTGRKVWDKNNALRMAYTATALEPAVGEDVKILGVDVDKTSLEFSAAADTTGKTVTVEGNGTLTASCEAEWVTAVISNGVMTVTVDANSGEGSAARSAVVTVTDSTGFTAEITVNQSAAA